MTELAGAHVIGSLEVVHRHGSSACVEINCWVILHRDDVAGLRVVPHPFDDSTDAFARIALYRRPPLIAIAAVVVCHEAENSRRRTGQTRDSRHVTEHGLRPGLPDRSHARRENE